MQHANWTLAGLRSAVRFDLDADCDAGLLPRLIEPFAKRGLTPDTLTARRTRDAMRVEIAMAEMPADAVQVVAGSLRQVVGVRTVSLTQEVTGSVQRIAA